MATATLAAAPISAPPKNPITTPTTRRDLLTGMAAIGGLAVIPVAAFASSALNGDADWLAAEREVLRLLDLGNGCEDDAVMTRYSDAWNALDDVILKATPRTRVQAAVKLRRLMCLHNGVWLDHEPHRVAARQIEAFLTATA